MPPAIVTLFSDADWYASYHCVPGETVIAAQKFDNQRIAMGKF